MLEQKMKKNSFYITTTLPYVNAPLHLGHATEIIRADTIARFKKIQGFDVFFNTGTDEHGQKIYESAEKAGKGVKEYVDYYADLYKRTLERFGVLSDVHYIRTTDENHTKAAKEFWARCKDKGFIYKKNYQAKYCVGCEEEKTESELVDGKCPEHDRVPDLINEENYFFKFSAFTDKLENFYKENSDFIVPNYRMNEMREFIKHGLNDFSISRLKSKMSWGIDVPGDEDHVMYVWFDALTNYISTLGWPDKTPLLMEEGVGGGNSKNHHLALKGSPPQQGGEESLFSKYWINGNPTQYCGKNNTRFQGLMWQAMLLAVDLPLTHQIIVDGFILGEGGIKMSKTLGNTIDPLDLIQEYGTDGLRYFVLRDFHSFEDTAVSKDRLKESYNANLANGLGNLTSRILTLSEKYLDNGIKETKFSIPQVNDFLNTFDIQLAMKVIFDLINDLDKQIQKTEPFKVIKVNEEEGKKLIKSHVKQLLTIAKSLAPFLPETSEKIVELIKQNKKPEKPLFLRKE